MSIRDRRGVARRDERHRQRDETARTAGGSPSKDARERRVRLSPYAQAILPQLYAAWCRVEQAEAALDAQLGVRLLDVVNAAVDAVERRRFLGGNQDEHVD